MQLTDFYPKPAELIENELNTLDLLIGDRYFSEVHSGFVNDANTSLIQYRFRRNGFRFESSLDVAHKEMPGSKKLDPVTGLPKTNLRLLIGSLIDQTVTGAFENISYFLVVSRVRSSPPTILRKFHFDVTPVPTGTRRQAHPVCHLQYCGKLTKTMENGLGYRPEHLKHMHSELSEPRVFFWPMSLALLIDLALREFAESSSYTFRQTTEWQNVIRKDETLLLQKFHERCLNVISSKVKNRPTLLESFYIR